MSDIYDELLELFSPKSQTYPVQSGSLTHAATCPTCGTPVTSMNSEIERGDDFVDGPVTFKSVDRFAYVELQPCRHRFGHYEYQIDQDGKTAEWTFRDPV